MFFCLALIVFSGALFFGGISIRKDYEDAAKICIVLGIIMGLCGGFGIIHPSQMIQHMAWETDEVIEVQDIVQTTSESGNTCFVVGYLGPQKTYCYAYESNGEPIRKQVSAEDASVLPGSIPYAEWHKQTKTYWYASQERTYCLLYLPNGEADIEYVIQTTD